MDWSTRWRDGLGARRFGRLTVVPSWLPEALTPDPHTVVLDPETAFGSGEHGSTRVALTLLEQLLRPGQLVLDLGSGSGILAIAAVKLGASRAIGIETDPEANRVGAPQRRPQRRVATRVEFLEGDAGVLAPLVGPADLILSNILRTANTALLPSIAACSRARRARDLLRHGAERGVRVPPGAAGQRRFDLVQETVDAGWWAVAAGVRDLPVRPFPDESAHLAGQRGGGPRAQPGPE